MKEKGKGTILGLAERLGYAAISIADNLRSSYLNTFMLFFCTNVLSCRPGILATLMSICTVWDAINDPMIASYADNHPNRNGDRSRQYLFASIPAGIVLVLLFSHALISHPCPLAGSDLPNGDASSWFCLPSSHQLFVQLRQIIMHMIAQGMDQPEEGSLMLRAHLHAMDHGETTEGRHVADEIVDVGKVGAFRIQGRKIPIHPLSVSRRALEGTHASEGI